MNNEKNLRGFVENETMSVAQRRDAAEMLVRLKLSAVPEPAADDPEVVELMTPWPEDEPLGSIATMAWRTRNQSNGWPPEGPSIGQARKHVHKRMKLRTLLAVVVDEAEHRFVRLAACDAITKDHQPKGGPRNARKSAEELLATVKSSTATKWTTGEHGMACQVVVSRPSQTLSDVW